MKSYIKEGRSIPYEVEIKNNKHTYLSVKQGYVKVRTNKRMAAFVETYIDHRFDALWKKLHQYETINDDEIQLWGNTYRLVFQTGTFQYEIVSSDVICSGINVQTVKKTIYLKEIKKMMVDIHTDVVHVIESFGIKKLPIKYKYLKSKFGSYHRKNNEITLNTFLATLDPIYLTYVLYHEYAHTKVFNHSRDFYHLLDQLMPGHKTIQKRLKSMAII